MVSELDSEQSVKLNYKSSHDTPDDPEDDDSEGSSTPEPTEELPLVPEERQSPNKTKRTPTPPAEKVKERMLSRGQKCKIRKLANDGSITE